MRRRDPATLGVFDLMSAQVPRAGKPLSLAFTLSGEMLQAALPRGVELTHESEAVLRDVRAASAARAVD